MLSGSAGESSVDLFSSLSLSVSFLVSSEDGLSTEGYLLTKNKTDYHKRILSLQVHRDVLAGFRPTVGFEVNL